MKRLFWIILLVGCIKEKNKPDFTAALIESHQTGTDLCAGTYSFTKIIYDATHFDSTLIQYPCTLTPGRRYPLFIYFHGQTNAPRPFNQLSSFVSLLLFENMRVPYDFISICPKDYDGFRTPDNINTIINYAIKSWPVDTTRIYLTGTSIGASNVLNYLADNKNYASRVAAAIVMIPIHLSTVNSIKLSTVKTPVNIYTGDEDVDKLWCERTSKQMQNNGGVSEVHLYAGGHCCTTDHYRITDSLSNGKNIYDWLIQFHR